MHIFHIPNITSKLITLSEEESKHCIKVLRLKEGSEIKILNGKGKVCKAKITVPHHKKCIAEIFEEKDLPKSKNKIKIAVAPTKNISRFEYFLEKAVEIGVDEIFPILCENSERKKINTERLERIVVAASKQSVKAHFPALHELTDVKKLITQNSSTLKIIAHCNENFNRTSIKDILHHEKDILILIGPEGDFSENEISFAEKNNFTGVTLSSERLRTETAAVVSLAYISFLKQ